MKTRNSYASSLSINRNLSAAIDDAAEQLLAATNVLIDLLVVMAAGYPASELDEHFPRISSLISANHIVGTTCESVISGSLELEVRYKIPFSDETSLETLLVKN